jgi:hypothetical protein
LPLTLFECSTYFFVQRLKKKKKRSTQKMPRKEKHNTTLKACLLSPPPINAQKRWHSFFFGTKKSNVGSKIKKKN